MSYYEVTSLKPILHVHFNHHFKDSTQFADFEVLLNEIYSQGSDYLEILYTDCDKDKGTLVLMADLTIYVCEMMSKSKDNRHITGTSPSSDFKTIAKKIIQSPPSSRALEHVRDIYSEEVISDFIEKLIPDFYTILNSKE